jgi:hypothetical protein
MPSVSRLALDYEHLRRGTMILFNFTGLNKTGFFETGCGYAAQAGLEHRILLPLSAEYWGYRLASQLVTT